MENQTPDPVQSISAAFDSVNLINTVITEVADDKKKNTVKRNVEHLEIMLTKEFFTAALTTQQAKQISDCIIAGNEYIV